MDAAGVLAQNRTTNSCASNHVLETAVVTRDITTCRAFRAVDKVTDSFPVIVKNAVLKQKSTG